ncbi:MAG: YHYH protein [Marinomonas colpomeniae]
MKKVSNKILAAIGFLIVVPVLAIQVYANVSSNSQAKTLEGFYDNDAITVDEDLVSCTLSNGTESECFRITVDVSGGNTDLETGPWCPQNISDTADTSGIWLDGGKVHDVDGEFVKNLATFYKDDKWQLYNPKTGKIRVTDSKTACLAAARPDVDPEYNNYCVQCLPEYVEEGTSITYLIPAEPQVMAKSEAVNPQSGVGVAFNGVKIEAPAPVDAILAAHTIAPFDDCGGHVNTHVGYHYHAVTDCTEEANSKHSHDDGVEHTHGHATAIGYAMDGYKLYGPKNADGSAPQNLDACNGHVTSDAGYHYHVNDPSENQILSCFTAEPGCAVEGDSTACNVERMPPPQDCKEGEDSCVAGNRPLPPECESAGDVDACMKEHKPPQRK